MANHILLVPRCEFTIPKGWTLWQDFTMTPPPISNRLLSAEDHIRLHGLSIVWEESNA